MHFPNSHIEHIGSTSIEGMVAKPFSATDNDDKIIPYLWSIIEGIILTNIENKQNLIVEGCYIPQDKVSLLQKRFLHDISVVYITFSEKYTIQHFQDEILTYRNIIEQRGYDDETNIKEYSRQHAENRRLCAKYNLPYVEIIHNYPNEIQAVFNIVEKEIISKSSAE